jgi:hypothetical protein
LDLGPIRIGPWSSTVIMWMNVIDMHVHPALHFTPQKQILNKWKHNRIGTLIEEMLQHEEAQLREPSNEV